MMRLLCFILLSTLPMGCSIFGPVEPPEPVLPALTQEGLGTMGCVVNGEVVVGRRKNYFEEINPVYAAISGSGFRETILAMEDRVRYRNIVLRFIAPEMDSSQSLPVRYYVWQEPFIIIEPDLVFRDIQVYSRQFVQSPDSCWIEFTRFEPYSGGVMAGTFSFDLLTPEGDTLEVREGRFDVMLIGI